MKYKISLGGRGGENYIHRLTSEQYDQFVAWSDDDGDIDLSSASIDDDIIPILGKEDTFDIFDTEQIILGPYSDSESIYIKVISESDEEVWSSIEDFDFESDFREFKTDVDCLVIQDYVKGEFKNFEIESESFDPSKIELIVEEIGYECEIVVGIKYDGVELEVVDFGDYWSKGFNFFLI